MFKEVASLNEFSEILGLFYLGSSIEIPSCELELRNGLAEIHTMNLRQKPITILYTSIDSTLKSNVAKYSVPPGKILTIEIKKGCTIKELSTNLNKAFKVNRVYTDVEFFKALSSRDLVEVTGRKVRKEGPNSIYVEVHLGGQTQALEFEEVGNKVQVLRKLGNKSEKALSYYGSLPFIIYQNGLLYFWAVDAIPSPYDDVHTLYDYNKLL